MFCGLWAVAFQGLWAFWWHVFAYAGIELLQLGNQRPRSFAGKKLNVLSFGDEAEDEGDSGAVPYLFRQCRIPLLRQHVVSLRVFREECNSTLDVIPNCSRHIAFAACAPFLCSSSPQPWQ